MPEQFQCLATRSRVDVVGGETSGRAGIGFNGGPSQIVGAQRRLTPEDLADHRRQLDRLFVDTSKEVRGYEAGHRRRGVGIGRGIARAAERRATRQRLQQISFAAIALVDDCL